MTGAQEAILPPWLEPELERLLALYDAGRLHHALLLTGRSGLGKGQLAQALARALLCEAAEGRRPCGRCRGCRLSRGAPEAAHPDLRAIGPASGEERGEIVVDTVRALDEFLHLSPQLGGSRVATIVPCDRLNRAAANSLLKGLEEPPAGVYLILATSRPGRLPPTLRSRCAVRQLPAPDEAAAKAWLHQRHEEAGAERIHRALVLHGGMPLAAEAALADRELEGFEGLVQQLHRLAAGGDPVKEAEAWAQAPGTLAEWAGVIVAELIRHRQLGAGRGLLPGELAGRLAADASPERLHALLQRLLEHQQGLEQPLNGRLAAEAVLLDLAEALVAAGRGRAPSAA